MQGARKDDVIRKSQVYHYKGSSVRVDITYTPPPTWAVHGDNSPSPHCLSRPSLSSPTLACLLSLSHSLFFLFLTAHGLTHSHTHTHNVTDSENTGSLYLFPPDSLFSIASFSAFPPFHSQTNRDSFILCLLFRPSLDNPPPSLCPLQENLLRLVHIEYSVKGKRDLLKPGRVSSMAHDQNTATHRSFNNSL